VTVHVITTTLKSITQTILTVFPDAEVGEDQDGQVIIHTGLYQVKDEAPLERCFRNCEPDNPQPIQNGGAS
jgi:hypothetical protein